MTKKCQRQGWRLMMSNHPVRQELVSTPIETDPGCQGVKPEWKHAPVRGMLPGDEVRRWNLFPRFFRY